MSDVFISYSRTDRDFVRRLFDALEANGRDAWVDWADIDYAEDWWQKICLGIEAADTFVFIITPESVRSKVCFDEVEHAAKNNKRIIPILRREVKNKADKQRMHPVISSINWLPFIEDTITEKSLSDLLDTMQRDPEHVRAHTRLLVRAKEWHNRQRNQSLLLRGNDLDQAEKWLNTGVNKDPVPTDLHAEYIAASRRAQRRFQRNIMMGVSTALVVAIFLSILSFILYRRAEGQLKQTTSLLQVADAQLALENGNQDLALALALLANQVDSPSSQAQNLLASLAYMPGTKRIFISPDGKADMIEVAISPDQKTIATIDASGSLVLWDSQSGQVITTLTQLTSSQSYGLVFSFDNRRLYSGDPNGHLLEWDLTNYRMLRDISIDGGISSLALTPDDQWLLIGTYAGETLMRATSGDIYYLYSLGTQEETVRELTINEDATEAVAFVGQRVVLWDLESREIIQAIETNDYSMAISSDFKTAVTAEEELHVWNLESGELSRTINTSQRAIRALAFSPDDRYILSGGIDSEIVLWSVDAGIPLATLYGHHGWIWDIDYSIDGSTAVSATWDGTSRWWNIKNPRVEHVILPSSDIIVPPVFGTMNRVVAYASSGGGLESMYLDTGELTPPVDTSGFPIDIAYSPDGIHALGGINSGELYYWNTLTGGIIHSLVGHRDGIQSVAISFDGRYALSAGWDNRIILWDLQTGSLIREFQSNYPSQVAFDHQGWRFLSVSDPDDALYVWDIASGEILLQTSKFNNGTFSPDDASILSRDGQALVLWGIQTQDVISRFTGHVDNVISAVFNQTGTQILSGAADGQVILWDVASNKPIRQFTEFDQGVGRVAFGQEGNTYWASSVFAKLYAAEVRIWSEETLEELIAWIYNNRYIYPLNCDELRQYNQCE